MDEEQKTFEITIATDCLVNGEAALAGTTMTVDRALYLQLLGAKRVCTDESLAAKLRAQRAAAIAAESAEAALEAEAASQAASAAVGEVKKGKTPAA